MRFVHRMAKRLCLALVVALVVFTGCASSAAVGPEAAGESGTRTANHPDGEPPADGSESSGASAAADRHSASSSGETADGDGTQRIELPPSRDIPISQLMQLVSRHVPERFIFLSDDADKPLRIYHDLDRNGYEDIFMLLVEFPKEARSESDNSRKSDNSRTPGTEQPDEGQPGAGQAGAEQPGEGQPAAGSARITQVQPVAAGEPEQPGSAEAGQIVEAESQNLSENQDPSESPVRPDASPSTSPELDLRPDEPQPDAIIRNRRVAASDLADMSRLFSEEIRPHKFYLALFLRTPGGLVSMYRIPLGSWFVFEDFRGFQLGDQRSMPYAVSTSFQTHEGKESQWVCFSKYNEFSFFTLKNSISVTTEIRDINSSGLLDILEWRKVFEEGTGYETFLTWYKWDGKKFAQHDSTNIVRNLNQFLHSASTLLSLGKWSQAFSLVLPEDQYRDLVNDNISLGTLFMRLFPSQPGRDEGVALDAAELEAKIDRGERVFNTVIVPRVLENPFAGEQQNVKPGYRTRFSIRFILRDGRSSVRECSVRMNDNPFAEQQYYIELQ